jgi:hypothetical protein
MPRSETASRESHPSDWNALFPGPVAVLGYGIEGFL